MVGHGDRRLELFTFLGPCRLTLLVGCELVAGLVQQRLEPVRDDTPWGASRYRVLALLLGEGAALGDGGDVGAVDGDDAVEDVAGFGDVVAVGDDADHVLVAAAGDGDVEAAAGRRRRGEADAGGDVVGLPAVLGRRVSEPDVLADVVGGEGDVAVSALVGHGHRSVVADGGDGPGVSVADRLTGRGGEAAVVAAGRHDVTDVGVFAAGDPVAVSGSRWPASRRACWTAWLMVSTWSLVDATNAAGRPCWWLVDPGVGHAGEVLVEGAGDDPAVGLVGVEGAWVAGSQQQRRGGLPGVGEAVQPFELVDAAVGAQLGEQAAPSDALQLAGIADEGEPPLVRRRRG